MTTCCAARIVRPALAALSLAFLLASAGCGPGTATLIGTVKYKGEPLPSGTVIVHGSNGQTATGTIEDGAYRVDKVPTGDVKISVQVASPGSIASGGGGVPGMPAGVGPAAGKDAFKGGAAASGQQSEHAPSTAIPSAGRVVTIPSKYA